jgi:hypothetical protein
MENLNINNVLSLPLEELLSMAIENYLEGGDTYYMVLGTSLGTYQVDFKVDKIDDENGELH